MVINKIVINILQFNICVTKIYIAKLFLFLFTFSFSCTKVHLGFKYHFIILIIINFRVDH